MIIRAITVRRAGRYGAYGPTSEADPFEVAIEAVLPSGEIKLKLSPDLSQRVVELIADEVAEAGRRTAEAMVAQALQTQAIEAKPQEAEA